MKYTKTLILLMIVLAGLCINRAKAQLPPPPPPPHHPPPPHIHIRLPPSPFHHHRHYRHRRHYR